MLDAGKAQAETAAKTKDTIAQAILPRNHSQSSPADHNQPSATLTAFRVGRGTRFDFERHEQGCCDGDPVGVSKVPFESIRTRRYIYIAKQIIYPSR